MITATAIVIALVLLALRPAVRGYLIALQCKFSLSRFADERLIVLRVKRQKREGDELTDDWVCDLSSPDGAVRLALPAPVTHVVRTPPSRENVLRELVLVARGMRSVKDDKGFRRRFRNGRALVGAHRMPCGYEAAARVVNEALDMLGPYYPALWFLRV